MELSGTRRMKALGIVVKWLTELEPTSIRMKPNAKKTWRPFCAASRPWLVTELLYKKASYFSCLKIVQAKPLLTLLRSFPNAKVSKDTKLTDNCIYGLNLLFQLLNSFALQFSNFF